MSGWRGFRAYLTRPHDGDSFWVMTDGGFEGRSEPELRLQDVHAPELAIPMPRGTQPGGREATLFVNDWLAHAQSADPRRRWYLSVAVTMTKSFEPSDRRSFTRYMARVWRSLDWPEPWASPPPVDGVSLNAAVTGYLAGHPEWPSGD